MSGLTLVLASVATLAIAGLSPLQAAELLVPGYEARAVNQADCGPCGCLQVTYVYHPELRSTYGLGFDPRNYDQTRPHYYLGRVRPYPRYFVYGVPVGSSC
jgi:hypothetical protein